MGMEGTERNMAWAQPVALAMYIRSPNSWVINFM